MTAWTALVDHCRVKAGDWVLVQGTGGVALFALKFAKAMGARVVVASSSDEKLERATQFGADELVNYTRHPEWAAHVISQVGHMDHVIEVGGAASINQSLKVVATGGNVALIGVLSGIAANVKLTSILMRGIKIHGVTVGSRQNMQDMFRAVQGQNIKPVIDKVFGFKEAEVAFDHLRSGGHFGKVAIGGFHA